MRKVLVLCAVCLAAATLAAAQSTTDGAIGGTVFDKTGAVVGNAQIVVHNQGTNAERTANADGSGYYRVGGLPPGTYAVTSSADGLAPYKTEVVVQVGSVTELSPRLGVAGGQATVEVTPQAPQINYASPEFSFTLNQTAITNLPINGGRWSNFSLLTPSVVNDATAFGLLSFRGISPLLNNNTVDGADNNQAFFSEERGRIRIGYSTPKEAIQEFQVNTSNYSAEYGRAAGGVVNAVTKSGTNAIHGEAYFFDRDNVWGAANPLSQIELQTSPGVFTPVNFKPTDWRKMAGFGVGGALIKDKLFWFVAFDWYRHNFPGVAVAANPNVFFAAPTAATLSTLAVRLGITPAQAATLYSNDLAGLSTLLGPVPRSGEQTIVYPKLDWAINARNHASFSFNRMRWSSPAGIQFAPTVTRGVASFGDDFVKDTWGVARLDSIITPHLLNDFRFQYGRDFEFEFSQPPAPYELANLVNGPTFTNPFGLPPTVSITNGFTFGVPSFLQRPAFPDEVRQQYADTMTWTHGKHTVKYGFDITHVDDNAQNLNNRFGSYSYSSLLNYFTDLNAPNRCAGAPCYSSFSQGFGPSGFDFATTDYALFAEDQWRVLPTLTLSLGLRYENEKAAHPFPGLINPLVPATGRMPADQNNFGPRIGFAWDITGSGKTVLRGGYGIYYGRIINSTIFSALTNTGMPGGQFSVFFTPTTPGAPVFPAILTTTPASTLPPSVVSFDPHFQNPQIHEFDLTVEREIGWGTVLSVSYLGSLGRELPDFVDTNICTSASQTTITASGAAGPNCAAPGTITYQVVNGGPLGAGPYTTTLFRPAAPTQARLDARFGAMTNIFSGVNSNYQALVVQANHRMSHHVQFSASYTWSHAIDFGQNETTFFGTNFLLFPNTIAPEKGNSQFDVPNRFVMNAVIDSPWKVTGWAGWLANDWEWAPIIQVQNGLPYTLFVAGNAPGGAIFGINGSGGTNRIDVLGNNSFRLPTTWVADMRVAKSFRFQERYSLELIADFFNLANKQNVMSVNQTGYIIQSFGTVATPTGPVACAPAAPCLDFNVNPTTFAPQFGTVTAVNSNLLYTPRQIQLGVRVHF